MSSRAFSRPVTAGTGNWGWVFARPVTAGTGVNGLKQFYNLALLARQVPHSNRLLDCIPLEHSWQICEILAVVQYCAKVMQTYFAEIRDIS